MALRWMGYEECGGWDGMTSLGVEPLSCWAEPAHSPLTIPTNSTDLERCELTSSNKQLATQEQFIMIIWKD